MLYLPLAPLDYLTRVMLECIRNIRRQNVPEPQRIFATAKQVGICRFDDRHEKSPPPRLATLRCKFRKQTLNRILFAMLVKRIQRSSTH